jgi:hypothetical protein
MLKRSVSDDLGVAATKKYKAARESSSSSSSGSEDSEEDDSTWVPSSEDESRVAEPCEQVDDQSVDEVAVQYSTRSRGTVAHPFDSGSLNAVMDQVDEEVNKESDFSSDTESEEEEGGGEDEDEDDEDDESDSDDEYSDDDSFMTSDDDDEEEENEEGGSDSQETGALYPVTLVRCDAGIPALDGTLQNADSA